MAQDRARINARNSEVVTRSAASLPAWLDRLLLFGEWLLRNIYWRWAGFRRWERRRERRRPPAVQECRREELRAHLRSIGVTRGALVMLHTRITGVRIHSGVSSEAANPWQMPEILLSDLFDLVGAEGTLTMLTGARYQKGLYEEEHAPDEIITYDPLRTPCDVGLVNELFWRKPGVKRSLFPYNMLAARGPLADELLRDNLNERKPSPHGTDSGYYRFCQLNGLVLSIGVPLADCMTLVRVVAEVRPDWPIKDFFFEQHFRVLLGETPREWTVRLLQEDYGKYCQCRRKMARDMIAEGVIHEGRVGLLRVDWAHARDVYDFFWRKTEKRPYPYYGVWLRRKPWANQT